MPAGMVQQININVWITCHVALLLPALLVSRCQNASSMMTRALREQHVMQLAVRAVGRVRVEVRRRVKGSSLMKVRSRFLAHYDWRRSQDLCRSILIWNQSK